MSPPETFRPLKGEYVRFALQYLTLTNLDREAELGGTAIQIEVYFLFPNLTDEQRRKILATFYFRLYLEAISRADGPANLPIDVLNCLKDSDRRSLAQFESDKREIFDIPHLTEFQRGVLNSDFFKATSTV